MNAKQALSERERLAGEVSAAQGAAREATARIAEIRDAERTIERRRTAALREQARTGKDAAVESLDAEQADLKREHDRETAASRAAREAQQEAQREFEQLHRDEFEAFAEHAESLTVEAMERLAALRQPYADAYSAWVAARREWNALARFNELDPCEHPPLAEPSSVFSARPPRPPQVERPGGPGPVDTTPAEPEAGTPRTWEHGDGRTLSTRVGDGTDRVLADDPDWRVVEEVA